MESEANEEAAARWFVQRGSGNWNDADQEAFDAWVTSSHAHRIAYIRIESVWNQAARMKALGAGVPPGVIPARGSWGDARFSVSGSLSAQSGAASSHCPDGIKSTNDPQAPQSAIESVTWTMRRSRFRVGVLAASLCVAVVAALYLHVADPFAGDRYSTAVGAMKVVHLKDGSRVTLNTNTKIRVLLGQEERHVDLIKGEAFFEVAKDTSHPFVVYAGDKRVMAVGTAFSVRRDSDDLEIVVTEGRVQLATAPSLLSTLEDRGFSRGSGAHAAATDMARPPFTFLRAGSIARTAKAEVIVQEQVAPEADEALSWRAGYVVFRDTTLERAVAEFNRYNTRQIVIEDPAIGALRVGGYFHTNNIDAFLSLIQGAFRITVDQNDGTVILRSR